MDSELQGVSEGPRTCQPSLLHFLFIVNVYRTIVSGSMYDEMISCIHVYKLVCLLSLMFVLGRTSDSL